MKVSIYNIFYKTKDRFIGYNTLNDSVLVFNENVYQSLVIGLDNLNYLEKTCPKTFSLLYKKGFIVNDDVNETLVAKSILYETQNDDSYFHIVINPTLNCNFNCWYCYENHIKSSRMSNMTITNILLFIERIIEEKSSLRRIHIDWFGGEPLLQFNKVVQPILSKANEYAEQKGIKLSSSFTTNGYLLSDKILDFCSKNNVKVFQITLDGHKERHNQVRYIRTGEDSYDIIVKHIKSALQKGINVSVRLNISSETNADIDSILKSFEDLDEAARKRMSFSINEVWQDRDKVTDEIYTILHEIRRLGFKAFIYESFSNGIRRTCYADKTNEVVINYDGKVYKCTARNFTQENSEGELMNDGTVKWNHKHFERMNKSAFDLPQCYKCSILPVCNARCSQQLVENDSDFCIYDFDNSKKMEFIRKRVQEKLFNAGYNLM